MSRSNNNTAFEEGWVVEGVPTEEQRKEEKRQARAQKKAEKKAEKKAAKADAKANDPYGIHHVATSYDQQQQQYDQANAAADYAQQNVDQTAWDYQVTNGHGTVYNHLTSPSIVANRLVQDSGYYPNTYQAYQGTVNDAHSRNYQTDIATQEFVNTIDGEQQRRDGAL